MSGRLEVEGLTLRVGDRVLVEGLSFSLAPGETLAVLGPSGVGKSRLLRALADLDPVETGTVRLDGETAAALGAPAFRAEIRYVRQRPAPVDRTARTQLERLGALAAQRARPHADAVALASGWGLPAERWDAPWAVLSGGEQQRLALAIALATQPRLLLLDEPTSALDAAAVQAVERDLAARGSVWITHDADQARRVAARRLELDGRGGWVLEDGGGAA